MEQVAEPSYPAAVPASVNIREAKANFSKLIRRAEAGEEIVIRRGRKPVARIAPLEKRGGHLERPRREAAARRILDAPDMEVPESPS